MDFEISVISFSGPVFEGRCNSLTLPLEDGLYTIKPGHSPVVAALSKGIMTFVSDYKETEMKINAGVCTFKNNSARVLIEK